MLKCKVIWYTVKVIWYISERNISNENRNIIYEYAIEQMKIEI